MNLFARITATAATLTALACTVTSTNNPGGSSGGGSSSGSGATTQQVSDCKAGCDKMKFFQCSSAADLASCYGNCDSAAPKAIEVFVACAQASICDPQCRTNIAPPPSAGSSGGSSSSGGTGASAASCSQACTKLSTTCSLIPVGAQQQCVDQCTKSGYQYQIDCVVNNQCADIKARCGATGGTSSGGTSSGGTSGSSGTGDPGAAQCQQQCDFLLARSCINASQQSTCRAGCGTPGSKRDTFIACAQSAGPCTTALGCFTTFTQ